MVSMLPATPTVRVRIVLTPTVISVKFVFEKTENKQKRGQGWPIVKVLQYSSLFQHFIASSGFGQINLDADL